MKIAIVGTGIAGNVVGWHLHRHHDITVFEAGSHVGGHTHTHSITLPDGRFEVDTGFIVFNDRTYPNFVRLLDELGVASQPSSMSFSVRDEASGLEYNGTDVDRLFVQRRNLVRPSFLGMVRDILRFHRRAPRLLESADDLLTLGEYVSREGYGRAFVDHYLVPMGAAIWSTDPRSMLGFPAHFFVRFLHNHGMLTVHDRPVWRVIRGGSARYVERLVAPFRHRIRLQTRVQWIRRLQRGAWLKAEHAEPERFDAVFLACHSDQALDLLVDPTREEKAVLGAIPYQRNTAVLHTDARLMPRHRRAWAAWNYHVPASPLPQVALTYDMNILQGIESRAPLLVTLNRDEAIDPERVLRRMTYHHPLFTPAGVQAQARHAEIDGVRDTYYCGAWWRNGFHEDGVVSALAAVRHFQERQGHGECALLRSA